MKKISNKEVRRIWLDFWKSKAHLIMDSSPLVPVNDPTLLWINAGIAPLKKYFDGSVKPPQNRLANLQKCIRTNDIENVGLTARHHTFFEMMGNFSIGDYFKKEAIEWGYEILISPKWFNLDLDKIYITYYPDDYETKEIWLALGIEEHRLIPLEGNFWEIGEGPCGPDTEIFYDRGEEYDKRGIELLINDIDNERYVEIWNIVFSSFNAKEGLKREEYPELPHKNIDTGAGLERFCAIMQDKKSNFETDLFMPIINHVEQISKIKYDGQKEFKIIADHIKAITVALADGAILSNEGRGYVLRRLLRRALKHARFLNIDKPFLYLLVFDVITILGDVYPNIVQNKEIIEKIIKLEEEKFLETLSDGEKELYKLIETKSFITGAEAFRLYDTFGFPIELTLEYAHENKIEVDNLGFQVELEAQKERSRKARNDETSMQAQNPEFLEYLDQSIFIGYNKLESNSRVIKVFKEGIVLDKTPFYAESGGQVSDQGTINGIEVIDVIALPNKQHLHIVDHQFFEGDKVFAKVDSKIRWQTQRNHSATHLLHKALKDVLGTQVNQHGSRVSPISLRFDFNNYESMTNQELLEVEKIVNRYINEQNLVVVEEMSLVDAKNKGAMALFTEKYGDVVRTIKMGDSLELCGGTHVKNTADIKAFSIVSYESIGSGIFRIEAVSGDNLDQQIKPFIEPLIKEINNLDEKVNKINNQNNPFKIITKPNLIGSYHDIINYREYIVNYKEQIKDYEKLLKQEKEHNVLKDFDMSLINGDKVVIKIKDYDNKVIKNLVDEIFENKKLKLLFIANIVDNKITYICKSNLGNASQLVALAAEITNGKGGGKPDFARGGGDQIEKLDEALTKVRSIA